MEGQVLRVLNIDAVDPHVDVLREVYAGKVLDALIDHEPWVVQELTSLVHNPDAHGPVCAACDQLLHLVDVDHV